MVRKVNLQEIFRVPAQAKPRFYSAEFFEKAVTVRLDYHQGKSPAIWKLEIKDGRIVNKQWIPARETMDFGYYKNGVFTYYLLDGIYEIKSTREKYSYLAIIAGEQQPKTKKIEKLVEYDKRLRNLDNSF